MFFKTVELNPVNYERLTKLKAKLATTNDAMVLERALMALEQHLEQPEEAKMSQSAPKHPTHANKDQDPPAISAPHSKQKP